MDEDEGLRKAVFHGMAGQGLPWLMQAHTLKNASDLLLDRARKADRQSMEAFEEEARKAHEGEQSLRLATPEEVAVIHDRSLRTVAYMLLAFAIENVAKGVVLARRAKERPVHEMDKDLRTHDLKELVQKAGMTLSEPDELILRTLSEFGTRGRYPVPLAWDQLGPRDPRHREEKRTEGEITERLHEIFAELWITLEHERS